MLRTSGNISYNYSAYISTFTRFPLGVQWAKITVNYILPTLTSAP